MCSSLQIVAAALVLLLYCPQVTQTNKTNDTPSHSQLGPRPGEIMDNPKDGLKYVWIPSGTFEMGCSPGDTECGGDEKPAHRVTISKGFWMGQTEVTVGAYKRFATATELEMPLGDLGNMPMVTVSWDDAQAYCSWAGGRLPTEAEWEYAARGGSAEARYGNIDDIAWYDKNSGGQTHEVAQKRANGFGIFDVLGNVSEWVNDWYDENYYHNSPTQDPPGPPSGKFRFRVVRGGSFLGGTENIRVSFRENPGPNDLNSSYGFRCVREQVK